MSISSLLHKNNNNFDLIRILLASMVIVGHALPLNGPGAHWYDPVNHYFPFTYSGALAVKIFFFISGLLVTASWLRNRSSIHFVISRFFRIMPALFFVLAITIFIVGPMVTALPLRDYFSKLDEFKYLKYNLMFATEYTLPGVFNDNLYKDAVNGSLWSLRYEVGCYLVLFAGFLLLANKDKKYLNIPIALVIIDAFLPNHFLFGFLGDNPEVNLLPASFAFGALYAMNSDHISASLKTVTGLFLLYYVFSRTANAQLLFVFASCSLAVYLASNAVVCKWKPKHDISYGIYLWGFLVQQTVFHYLGNLYVGLHILIALSVSIALALVTCLAVEKPAIQLGKWLIKRIQERFPAADNF